MPFNPRRGTLQFGPRSSVHRDHLFRRVMEEPSLRTPSSARPPEDRLDSWKEIAAHLSRDVTTVQRWEKREGMPVHRHLHDRMGSVYASRAELDAWARSRKLPPNPANRSNIPCTS